MTGTNGSKGPPGCSATRPEAADFGRTSPVARISRLKSGRFREALPARDEFPGSPGMQTRLRRVFASGLGLAASREWSRARSGFRAQLERAAEFAAHQCAVRAPIDYLAETIKRAAGAWCMCHMVPGQASAVSEPKRRLWLLPGAPARVGRLNCQVAAPPASGTAAAAVQRAPSPICHNIPVVTSGAAVSGRRLRCTSPCSNTAAPKWRWGGGNFSGGFQLRFVGELDQHVPVTGFGRAPAHQIPPRSSGRAASKSGCCCSHRQYITITSLAVPGWRYRKSDQGFRHRLLRQPLRVDRPM